jgi:serine/threonine protein kinase
MAGKRFKVIRKFPQGQNGVTFEGVEISTDKKVAIKIISINEGIGMRYPNLQTQIEREPTLLQEINHKYVVKLVGEDSVDNLLFSDECTEYSHNYSSKKCIVTEYIEGKSFQSFREYYKFSSEEDALKAGTRLIFQIGYGLAHCHKKNIFHRDLHQNNIIIRDFEANSREAVIIDFGLGKKIELLPTGAASRIAVGTFRAPEMTNDKFIPTSENSASADLFSFVATFLWWLTDGTSSSLTAIRDSDNKERRYHGLNFYRDNLGDVRPKEIFNIIGQDRWDKLNKIISDVLVNPSVYPYTEREPKTVTEWLNRLREIFPEYDPGDPSEGYFEDLGNGAAIEMVKVPERNVYISKAAITKKQWREIMNISPLYAAVNEDVNFPAKGLSFDEASEFIKQLNSLTKKNYRLPTSEEILHFNNFQDICFVNNEELYVLHLQSSELGIVSICYRSTRVSQLVFHKHIHRPYRCIGSHRKFCFYIVTDCFA